MNTITIQQLHKEMELTRAQVLRLTGMRENDLNDLMIDNATEWLRLITHNDARALEFIPRTREFWGFWKKTWHKVDVAFLQLNGQCPFNRHAEIIYCHMHRVTRDNIHMNNATTQANYHMLRSMITHEKF